MKVEQISIFLENKSGRLAEVTGVLAKAGSTSAPSLLPTRRTSGSCALS